MGSPETEDGRNDDELQHEVKLTRGFWMGTYEVTLGQWADVVSDDPVADEDRGRVKFASWDDAHEFLSALNNGGNRYRLPTEAEWEYACRAGSEERFYWGDDPDETEIEECAWYELNSSVDEWGYVGEKRANAWGLYDMSGGLWEWCQDQYGPYPEGPVTDPLVPPDEYYPNLVLRGGCWATEALECRSANRNSAHPSRRGNTCGFRVLRGP